MKAKQKKRRSSYVPGSTWTQDERRALGAKIIVSMVLTAEGLKALDKMRGKSARGVFVEELLGVGR